jgi:glycosyltransferase involved in cell wall biosynthesis
MAEPPLVSIVTPSLDQGRFLEDAIRSVLDQDYARIEHVVVDGGSTDGTVELLGRHAHLTWISEPDEGQSEALNKALALSSGEVIGWLNADDRYLPGAVASAVAALERNPDAGMVYGNYVDVDEAGCVLNRNRSPGFSLERLINDGNLVPQPAAFVRRTVLERVGFVDPELHYAMDYDLWIRIGKVARVVHVDEYWAEFRLHPAAKSVARLDAFWREERLVSRRNGGKLLSGLLVRHVTRSYPRLGTWLLRGRRAVSIVRGRS